MGVRVVAQTARHLLMFLPVFHQAECILVEISAWQVRIIIRIWRRKMKMALVAKNVTNMW